jgi:beta-lactamase regulating signal transducer with metallopeptidase domain
MPSLPPLLVTSLVQWTLLLGLGWIVHAVLRHRHPRARLILWRGVLCCGLLVPIAMLLPFPRLSVSPPSIVSQPGASVGAFAPVEPTTTPIAPRDSTSAAVSSSVSTSSPAFPPRSAANRWPDLPWPSILLAVWFVGTIWQLGRLFQLHIQVRQAVRRAIPAEASVQQLAERIRNDLGIQSEVTVCATELFPSPILCGVMRPKILIPRGLLARLNATQLGALLTHEMAHQCRHDLSWLLAWRSMRAVYWFHPLVWRIPEAHLLACEEEADRIAADRFREGDGYMSELARLVLQLVQPADGDGQLALNAASHIGQRLNQLRAGGFAGWSRKHTLIGIASVGLIAALATGWEFSQRPAPSRPMTTATMAPAKPVAMNTVLVTVLTADHQPIAGATITPFSLHTNAASSRSSAFSWRRLVYGPVESATTDQNGKAAVKYPVYIDQNEQITTSKISLTVAHADFATSTIDRFPVDGSGKPIQLAQGSTIRVSGYVGTARESVPEIFPTLLGEQRRVPREEWRDDGAGHLVWHHMSSGKHFLHVSGRLRSGELVYSEGEAFFGEQSDTHDLAVEMKPGIRIEGRIDPAIPRPIKNGWVQLSVHSDEANLSAAKLSLPMYTANTGFWWSYRPVAPDGTFVFESVPAGDFKVIAYGDGFISSNGALDLRPTRNGPRVRFDESKVATRGVPQSFGCTRPITVIQVAAERTATLKVTAKANGKPVAGATIYTSPNVIQMPTGSRVFGQPIESSESPFRTQPPIPPPVFSATTDTQGVAVLTNLPAFTHEFGVTDTRYEVGMHFSSNRNASSRYQDITLNAGQTTECDVTLQPKGNEFLGVDP